MSTFSKIAQGLRLTGVSGATNDMVGNWLKGLGLAGATPDMLFAYLRSTGLTGSLSDMLSAYVFPLSAITKVLVDLDGTSNGYYSFSSPQVFTDDFEIEIDFRSTNTGITQSLFGRDTQGTYLQLRSNGDVLFFLEGTAVNASGNFDDGELHTARVLRSGFNINLFIDGTSLASSTSSASLVITKLGGWGNAFSNYFKGVLSNARLNNTTTPANSLVFGLDNLTGNTEVNNGITLTYERIAETVSIRDTYDLSANESQWVGSLQTIDIATQTGTNATTYSGSPTTYSGSPTIYSGEV
jgi:hypothetical protein